MVNTISIRELRPKLAKVMKDIHKKFDRYIVTRRGAPEVVMLHVEDYESLLETIAIESDKALMARIRHARKDLQNGKVKSLEEIQAELKIV